MPNLPSTSHKRYLFFISQDYSFPVLRPLQKAIETRGDEVKWFLYGKELTYSFLKDTEQRLLTVSEIIDYSPHAVFVPGNVVPSFIPGLKVEVFHGLPGNKTKKSGEIYHYIIRGMFDLYCTQGPASTKVFKSLSKKYSFFHVQETGWCKLDPLFYPEEKGRKHEKKAIFFASTFSPRYTKAKVLHTFILEFLNTHNYQWYVTLHPKMDAEIVNLYRSISHENLHFIDPTEVLTYFKKSDIMLCDISSIIYEFLTQRKPVITFQSPEVNKAVENVENFNALETMLITALNHPSSSPLIEKEIQSIHPYTDGKSSERVLDCVEEMLEGRHIPKTKKPLNLIRNLKLRYALNYWRFF